MEGQLVKKTYTIDNISFDFWMINIGNKFWFKAHDAAVFLLDYEDPDYAVRRHVPPKARQQWVKLEPRGFTGVQTPLNWKPHTIFISEGGLYRLICRNRKPEAVRFERWVFEEVLPTLRERGQYMLHEQLTLKNELIEIKTKLIEIKNERIATKDAQIAQLQDRVAVITIKEQSKHVFQLYKHRFILNMYLFFRPQKKYLLKALRVVNLEVYELLINEANVPNSMSILNRLKEKLKEQGFLNNASNNKLTVDADVPEMVRELILKSLQ